MNVRHKRGTNFILVLEYYLHCFHQFQNVSILQTSCSPYKAGSISLQINLSLDQFLGHPPHFGHHPTRDTRQSTIFNRNHSDVVILSRAAPIQTKWFRQQSFCATALLNRHKDWQERSRIVSRALHSRNGVKQDDGAMRDVGKSKDVDISEAVRFSVQRHVAWIAFCDDLTPF